MRFQGLGRKENPTERAIVEVVHPDGTYDCRVPGRPHPYTRLQTCGGQRPLHVGQTVEVAFVDYQRTGRRWMPFILGASKSHLESGMSRGRVSRGLAWHNGVNGTPDYTGSLYSLDTGYRKWRHDAGWSIPGPWVSIVGYTTHRGYIVTLLSSHLRCYDAASGQLVWQRTVSGAVRMRYNPTLQELLAIGFASFTVLDADTGEVVWSTSEGISSFGGLGIVPHLDRIYNLTPPGGYAGQGDPAFARWVRTSTGYQRTAPLTLAHPFSPGQAAGAGLGWSMSNISPSGMVGYAIRNRRDNVLTMRVKEETYRKITYTTTRKIGYSPPSDLWWDEVIETPVNFSPPDGIPIVYYQYFRNDCKRAWYWGWVQEYYEGCWGVLDLATETCYVRESFVAEPPPVPAENYSNPEYWEDNRSWRDDPVPPRPGVDYPYLGVTLSSPFVPYHVHQEMAADGSFYGSYVWDSQGNRWGDRGNYNAGSQPAAGPILVRSATPPIVQNAQRHVLWEGPSGDSLTGHGGESTRGEASWVLVASPGGWHFRDFKTGTVLGPWAGSMPVMVSAGIIYDTDDDGNLRRWTE